MHCPGAVLELSAFLAGCVGHSSCPSLLLQINSISVTAEKLISWGLLLTPGISFRDFLLASHRILGTILLIEITLL